MPSPVEMREWHQREVIDSEGKEIGHAEDIYVDDRTGEPAFLLVRGGLFGMKMHFVPVEGARVEGDQIRVAWDYDTIKNAPRVSADEHLSEEEEMKLFEHYGLDRGDAVATVLVLRRMVIVG
jgi:sporulation protein YlmC with PRC-barrel domain